MFHIHDIRGPLTPYCSGWDLADFLFNGFGGMPGYVRSVPPKHLSTALLQLVNHLFTLQGETAGAVAVSNWDTLLAPFVREDNLNYDQVKQIVQEFVFNMNVPTRVGFQPPFSNISLDIEPSEGMKKKNAVVGGEVKDYTYGECREEMKMLQRAFFEIMLEGDGAGRPFSFPIPTIDINHDFDWGNPVLDPLWESTSKYGIPYFANYINTGMNRDDTRSMCCRLRIDTTKFKKGSVFASRPLTGSIGVATLNLPRLALIGDGYEDFVESVKRMTLLASSALIKKRKYIEDLTERGMYPYTSKWLQGIKDQTGSYWSQHYLTIGVLGMHEALMNLGIEGGIESGKDMALDVLKEINKILNMLETTTGFMFNLEATPAEGACYKLARMDRETFGEDAHFSGTEEHPYYTQATMLPANTSFSDDLWGITTHQEELQGQYTGGTVLHLWTGERQMGSNVKNLVRKMFENSGIPYLTITPTFSVCETHGYMSGRHDQCPECGGTCNVYSRVVGYLRPVQQWNDGKRAEFEERRMLV